MAVKFYPEKPIDLLERFIVKADGSPLQGEIDVYRRLHLELAKDEEEWHVWHDIKLPVHSDIYNQYGKTSSQIDFLILCKQGILILEIKGGPISFRDNTFYYGRDFVSELPQDPFRQSEGYKYTVKDKILNNITRCCFCHSVAFPHVDYAFESRVLDKEVLWTKYKSLSFNNSLRDFILHVFNHTKRQQRDHSRHYRLLDPSQIEAIKRVLSPVIKDRSRFDHSNTMEWLQIDNLEILEGLSKNKRIMLEGPPGSGKTTIAKAFIDQQVGKSGIYLCWNSLLMHYTKKKIHERAGLESIEVTTITKFILNLNPKLNPNEVIAMSEEEFRQTLSELLMDCESLDKLPSYDFMVIDEAQDIFDRGVDVLMDKLCGYNRSGLTNGTLLVLFDIDQSYTSSTRNVLEISHVLSEYFAHFKLSQIKRSAQRPSIQRLASRVLTLPLISSAELQEMTSTNISVSVHRNLESVKKLIVNSFLSPMRDESSSLRGGDCVLLIESTLLRGTYNSEPDMHFWLTIKDVEELDEHNVTDQSNKLRYTSILKFKGLEKENVFLVVTQPSIWNKYELFVGVTRAIDNLEIMIVES